MVENYQLRKLRIAVRDLKNKITGKQELIEEYYVITHKITTASDNTPSGTERKLRLMEAYNTLSETTYAPADFGFTIDGFDPYRASKRAVKKKVELGRKLLVRLGLQR